MKKIFNYIMVMAMIAGFASCQKDSFRKVYPHETPSVTANIEQDEVLYGSDSITVNVHITAKQTPLSTLTIMVTVGEQESTKKIAQEVVRTKDYDFEGTFSYAVPFASGMEEGAPLKVYLTAENVEGDKGQLVVAGCIGHRPSVETLYIMPPTIQYTAIGKGKQMTKEDNGVFAAYDLKYPKTVEFLLATVGTKFGRVDWSKPVFGLIDGEISLITEEQFNNGEATSIVLADDRYSSIDTIMFDPISFELTFSGTISMPVNKIDVNVDLEENPAYMSASAAKEYRGAKIYLDKNSEVEIDGVVDLSKAYNLDYMEYLGGNKVKFLGDKGMYYISYKTAEDYIVVEPLYDMALPDVMYLCGVGMGQPSWEPKATSGWGFDSPNQNFVARTIAPKIYQFTVYMKNDTENTDHPGFGSVNFKFFHQHGWGGEETSLNYTQVGLNIASSNEESNVGNWWSTSDPLFEGIYRITLDMNAMSTTYEKIR